MKRGWIVLIGGLALAVGGTALAQMGPGMMGPGGMMGPAQQQGQTQPPGQRPGPGMMGPGMMGRGGMMGAGGTNDRPWITVMLDHREELGLSAEQVGQLFTLRDGFAREARKKSEALEKVEQNLDQLLGPGPVDLQAVEAKLKEAEAMRTGLRLARIKVIEEGKGVLTPEQRAKFVELVKQSPRSSGGATQGGSAPTACGMEEMQRFMQSDQAPQAMAAMMEMARRMGDGDVMLGMARMMEMMGSMGGMMGPEGEQ